MRTNVDIDDRLMKAAMKASGVKTKKAAIEEGLRLLSQVKGQKTALSALFGKVAWQGDLDKMRQGWRVE